MKTQVNYPVPAISNVNFIICGRNEIVNSEAKKDAAILSIVGEMPVSVAANLINIATTNFTLTNLNGFENHH